jgi:hypothetical protein
MGKLLDFEKPHRERVTQGLMGDIGAMYKQASEVSYDYCRLMVENPTKAIQMLPEFLERARGGIQDRRIEGMAGGPNHDWTTPMFNILGAVYPTLDRDAREVGLKHCLKFLDGINGTYSQFHVELINEPWLASDIVITRPSYFCGYIEYCNFAKKNQKWENFSKIVPRSAFWLSMAITHPEYTSLEVRKNYYEQFPTLMDRTKDAIAAMVAAYGGRKAENKGLKLEDCINERLIKHDPILHKEIRVKIEEKKWILLDI